MRSVKVAPSILAADFATLAQHGDAIRVRRDDGAAERHNADHVRFNDDLLQWLRKQVHAAGGECYRR